MFIFFVEKRRIICQGYLSFLAVCPLKILMFWCMKLLFSSLKLFLYQFIRQNWRFIVPLEIYEFFLYKYFREVGRILRLGGPKKIFFEARLFSLANLPQNLVYKLSFWNRGPCNYFCWTFEARHGQNIGGAMAPLAPPLSSSLFSESSTHDQIPNYIEHSTIVCLALLIAEANSMVFP